MKKEIKKENSTVSRLFDAQKMRNDIVPRLQFSSQPDEILKQLHDKITNIITKDGKASFDKESQQLLISASMIIGLNNHYPLINGMKEFYSPLAIEFANTLTREFDCKTPSEKALVHTIVNSYIRILDDTKRYNSCSDAGEYISEERTKHLSMLSKQMDRANRQFINALTTLKQIKSPPIQISLKTNTAFIAQNQQLNNNPTPNENATV